MKLNNQRINDYLKFKQEYELEIAHTNIIKILEPLGDKYNITHEHYELMGLKLAEIFNILTKMKEKHENEKLRN